MSATRDRSQRVTFVYSNLYKIYRAGVDAAKKAEIPENTGKSEARSEGLRPGLRTQPEGRESEVLSRLNRSHVLKSGQLKYGVKVREHQPTEFIAKRVTESRRAAPAAQAAAPARSEAPIESLKRNLEQLQDLHSRLRFMLRELEDLSDDEK